MDNSRKKRKQSNIGLVLMALLGVSILLYPTVSNRWNEYRASRIVMQQRTLHSQISEEDMTEYIKAAQKYNDALVGSKVPDSFSIHENQRDEEYESYLNLAGDGIMGDVEIPCIAVKIPVYHYTSDEVLAKGAGHLLGSSLPVGGTGTHAVISAHRGLPSAKLFTDLNLVKEGDVFYLHILNEILAYEVDQILTVEPTQTEALAIDRDKDYVTLVTCTPYAVNTMRLLVRGHRIPYTEESYQEQTGMPSRANTNYWIAQLVCIGIGIILAAVIIFVMTRLDERRKKTRHHTKKLI